VTALLVLNGMEPTASLNAKMEKFSKTVFVFAQLDSLNKMADAITDQNVRKDMPGTEKNVRLLLVFLDNHSMENVDAAKLQFINAPLVPIGMDIDVLSSLITAQLVWFGKTFTVLEMDHQLAPPTVS